jgi:hypothetical protein
LALRRQQTAPTTFGDWLRLYRRKLRHPDRLAERVKALVEAENWSEIDRLVDDVDPYFFEGLQPIFLHDLDRLERRILVEICHLLAQTGGSIAQLSRAVTYIVEAGVDGDFVECGVYKGASIVCMIRTLQALGIADRRFWLYDTFEGMPKPDTIDRHYAQTHEEDGGLKSWHRNKFSDERGSNWCYCPIGEVQTTVFRTKYPRDKLTFVKGLVENTIPRQAPDQIALLRLDTDFYSSTRHELIHLYPRLAKGGVLIVDDYGAYQGSRLASDEYFRDNNVKPLLSRIDENVRMFVKP